MTDLLPARLLDVALPPDTAAEDRLLFGAAVHAEARYALHPDREARDAIIERYAYDMPIYVQLQREYSRHHGLSVRALPDWTD